MRRALAVVSSLFILLSLSAATEEGIGPASGRSSDAPTFVYPRGKNAPTAVGFWSSAHGLVGTGGNPHRQQTCPGSILATDDGGATFQKVLDAPGGISWIQVTDSLEAWAKSQPCDRARPLLFHTVDGGDTWTSRTVDRPLRSLTFVADGVGFALSYRDYDLLRSSDGGKTWAKSRKPCHGFDTGNISAVDANHVFAECSYLIGAGSEDARLYVSNDGGETFARRGDGFCPRLYYLDDLSFGTTSWGLTHADFATACRTVDGGRTWEAIPVKAYPRWGHLRRWHGQPGEILGMQAGNAGHGWMLLWYERGVKLARTADFGESWGSVHRWRFIQKHRSS